MIPQLSVAHAPGSLPGKAGGESRGAADAPLAGVFGDLLGGMTPEGQVPPVATAPLTPELSEAATADLLALLAEVQTDALPVVSPGSDGSAAWPGPSESDHSEVLAGLWLALSEARLPAGAAGDATTAMAGSLASAQDPVPVTLAAAVDSRLAGSEALLASAAATPAPGALAVSAGVLEVLQSLSPAGQPATAADAGSSTALAAALPGTASERLLEATAGRLPASTSLPPQELRATVSQTLEQVAWMSQEGVHRARLQLEPAHLGRVDIWLDIEGGEARLHLGAQQAQVREALEAVLPRLRDALAEQGMTLTDASVSHSGRDDASGQAARDGVGGEGIATADDGSATEQDEGGLRLGQQVSALLDLYA